MSEPTRFVNPRYVYWWAKREGKSPVAGGFLRCDGPRELAEFVAQCEDRGLAVKVDE